MTNTRNKNKNKKNSSVLTIVLIIMTLGLIVFCIAYAMKKNNKQTNNPGNTSIVATTPPTSTINTPEPTKEPFVSPTLVEYSGKVEHLFTHSLVAFSDLAYDNSITPYNQVYNTYFKDCLTVNEFKKILQALYEDNYVLVDINYIYEAYTVDGNTQYRMKSSFLFPAGKKPLILSFDDVNYYADKQGNGMVGKLILQNNKIVSCTKMKDGSEVISDDNEHVPILDKFVEMHPNFSYNGAKGMLCVTGFDGVLGYRTQRIGQENDTRTEADRQAEIEAVKPIIKALKDSGWYFASHSYKHGNMANYSASSMTDCASKFASEVTPLIGDTKIYVYPYGSWARSTGAVPPSQAVLNSYGFQFFCSVGINYFCRTMTGTADNPKYNLGGIMFMDRANLDGFSITNYDNELTSTRFPSMNFDEIYDEEARGISRADAKNAYATAQ